MYELDWGSPALRERETRVPLHGRPSRLRPTDVASTMLVHWQEHCVECAPPECYTSCLLYDRRDDLKCARLAYGIVPNRQLFGLFNYGAELRFRRWGKLETTLRPRPVSARTHRVIDATDRIATSAVNAVGRRLRPLFPNRPLNRLLTGFRERLLNRATAEFNATRYDDFVIECYLVDPARVVLVIEAVREPSVIIRESVSLRSGHNFVRIPAHGFHAAIGRPETFLRVYSALDATPRLIFTWLDFVAYRAGRHHHVSGDFAERDARPSAKIKCVAWDLDNTVWSGTLLDDGRDRLHLRKGVVDVMRALDERGILQTVASKNDPEQALPLLAEYGLQDFFLHPAVNWGAKSSNLGNIAKRLNIGLDTIALIDDSAFERAEVEAALPMVRTYAETELERLLTLPEFDVPVTEMSARRRLSYRTESMREAAREGFPDDYSEFLRSCEMRMRVFVPREPEHVQRCHELVQRSNQLNLSSRRYTADEFAALLGTPGVVSLAIDCEDRFGSYGIVGFVTVDERAATPIVTNFVLSCRVAQKRVEHALFRWLCMRARERRHQPARAAGRYLPQRPAGHRPARNRLYHRVRVRRPAHAGLGHRQRDSFRRRRTRRGYACSYGGKPTVSAQHGLIFATAMDLPAHATAAREIR